MRLDEPFLLVRTNRNDDLIRRKSCKSIADRETNVRLASTCLDGLAGKGRGRVFGYSFCATERLLVVCKPVEHALPYDRHHDLDCVGRTYMSAQNVVSMFDGADDEDVSGHDGNVPPGRARRRGVRPELALGAEPAEGLELADTVAVEPPPQCVGVGLAYGPAAIRARDERFSLGHLARIRRGPRLTLCPVRG